MHDFPRVSRVRMVDMNCVRHTNVAHAPGRRKLPSVSKDGSFKELCPCKKQQECVQTPPIWRAHRIAASPSVLLPIAHKLTRTIPLNVAVGVREKSALDCQRLFRHRRRRRRSDQRVPGVPARARGGHSCCLF